MPLEPPPLLAWLSDALNVGVRPAPLAGIDDATAWLVDLSRFRLRLGERTPWIHLPVATVKRLGAGQVKRLLDDIAVAQGWHRRNLIAQIDGDGSDLGVLCRAEIQPPLILDRTAQERILAGPLNSNALIAEISLQAPISALAPYETSRPVLAEQFFGRERELRQIHNNANTSFLILGNRRMGKTSLARESLRQAARRSPNPEALRYFDCSVFADRNEFYADLVRELDGPREVGRVFDDRTFSMQTFLQRVFRAKREKLMLVLDEVDKLLEWDRRDGWAAVSMLRAVSNSSVALAQTDGPGADRDERQPLRVIMAGFRLAQKYAADRETPLFNFVTPIRVTNFDLGETEHIVLDPFLNLGLTVVDRSAVVGAIHRETGGQPNLIQHYCAYILRRLEQLGRRDVTPELVNEATEDTTIRERVAVELMMNSSNLEQFIVFSYLQNRWGKNGHDRFTAADADAWLEQRGAQAYRVDIEAALTALETTGFLSRQGRTYAFAYAGLPRALSQSYDARYQLGKILKEGL